MDIPHEISRDVLHFIEISEGMHGKVCKERFKPSSTPKTFVKIPLIFTFCIMDNKQTT